jgi:hypothetical protein
MVSSNRDHFFKVSLKFWMRTKGLEPSRLAALEPKSSASANSATSAQTSYSNLRVYQICRWGSKKCPIDREKLENAALRGLDGY